MFGFLQRRETLDTEAIRTICKVMGERNEELKSDLQRVNAHYYEETEAHNKTRAAYERTKKELNYSNAEVQRLNHQLWEAAKALEDGKEGTE